MKPRISVIFPTYNESMNIKEMIDRTLKAIKEPVEIIVSDDNSPDQTGNIVEDMTLGDVKVIRRYKNKGVAPSIWEGIKAAKGDIIVWMDADLSMPPEVIPKLLDALKDSDVAVGSRYAKGGRDKRDFIRVVTSRMINLLANIVLNFKILDYDTGFVAVKKCVFDKVKFDPKGHGEYCIEFLYRCTKKGFRVKEVGYVFTNRLAGESKTSQYMFSIMLHGFKYVYKVFKIRISG